MKFRFAVSLAFFCSVVGATDTVAQDAAGVPMKILEEVIMHFANNHSLRLDQVFVDSVRAGRVSSREPLAERARVITVPHLQNASERLGFRLGDSRDMRVCTAPEGLFDEPCVIGEHGVGLMVGAPDIRDGAATVLLMYALLDPNLRHCIDIGIMRYELTGQALEWNVSKAVVEMKGSPSRGC
jgi:hypothetical protein